MRLAKGSAGNAPASGARRLVIDWHDHRPAHFYAVGAERAAESIEKLGRLPKTETVRVC